MYLRNDKLPRRRHILVYAINIRIARALRMRTREGNATQRSKQQDKGPHHTCLKFYCSHSSFVLQYAGARD